MKTLCAAAALWGLRTAMVPPHVPARGASAAETAARQEIAAVGAAPETGGQDLLFPAAGLLLAASILAYAVLRRLGRP